MTIRTNKKGIDFISHLEFEILGVEITASNEYRKEQTIIGTIGGRKIAVIVPQEDGDTEPCIFGNLEYFAAHYAADETGIKLNYNNFGFPIHPIWYTNNGNQMHSFLKIYQQIIEKYK